MVKTTFHGNTIFFSLCHRSICSQSDWYYSTMVNYSLLGSAIYIISLSSVLPQKSTAQFPFLSVLCHSVQICAYLKMFGHDGNGFFAKNWAKRNSFSRCNIYFEIDCALKNQWSHIHIGILLLHIKRFLYRIQAIWGQLKYRNKNH